MSGLASNFCAYLQPTKDGNTMMRPLEHLDMVLEWYVLDGTNRQLVNINDKSVATLNHQAEEWELC